MFDDLKDFDLPLQYEESQSTIVEKLKNQATVLPKYAQNYCQTLDKGPAAHSLLCLNCEKILYKISKIFRIIYDIKQRSGLEGLPGKLQIEGAQSVDLIDFNFNMSGNTQFDQVRILEYLDRWGSVVEK